MRKAIAQRYGRIAKRGISLVARTVQQFITFLGVWSMSRMPSEEFPIGQPASPLCRLKEKHRIVQHEPSGIPGRLGACAGGP